MESVVIYCAMQYCVAFVRNFTMFLNCSMAFVLCLLTVIVIFYCRRQDLGQCLSIT